MFVVQKAGILRIKLTKNMPEQFVQHIVISTQLTRYFAQGCVYNYNADTLTTLLHVD